MADPFAGEFGGLGDPATRCAAITPHASNPLANVPQAIYVGTGGDITLRAMNDSADVLFKNVPSGAILPVRATHVRISGTTAADLVALL